MSKAYVIKNKEGKYFGVADNYNYEHYWTTLDFAHYFRYLEGHDAKAEAEEYRNTRYPDCQVVEITIAEGDLEQELNKYKSLYIENEKVVDYQHDKLIEKDKEIEELKTRVAELQDKDWYEACIKQLEEQNDKLIKERDEIQKELETSVDYWKNEVFKKIEVKVAELPNEKVREIRKQVCDMARKKIVEATCYDTEVEVRNVIYGLNASAVLEILDQIEGNANGK